MSGIINQVRFYHYICGVLAGQKADPLCSTCKAYVNTVSATVEGLSALKHQEQLGSLPEELLQLFEEAQNIVQAISLPEDAVGQKKAGNCEMPEGVCFVKSSRAILSRISG
jgi:hypothetical protein